MNKFEFGKKSAILFVLICIAASCTGCAAFGQNKSKTAVREIFAMDTYMTVTCYGENAEAAAAAACDEINRLDALLSTENESSELSMLNRDKKAELSGETVELLEQAVEYAEETEGAYDPTVYPLMKLWGFIGKSYNVPSETAIKSTLNSVDYQNIRIEENIVSIADGQGVDLGGIAKGYTSSKIMNIFKEYELDGGIVNLGGNVQFFGSKPDGSRWTCGIRSPFEDSRAKDVLGTLELEDKAVITSGGYERYFNDSASGEKYHHIIDTKTGYPAKSDLLSVTIVASDGTQGDALSTALYAMGKDRAVEFYRSSSCDFDIILVDSDENVYVSEGIYNDFDSALKTFEVAKVPINTD